MYRIVTLLWLLCCSMSLWAQVPLNRSVQWYAQAGLVQHHFIEQAMQAKRHVLHMLAAPSVKLGSAQKAWPKTPAVIVNTCQDYLHYLHRRYVPAGPVDQRISDDYERICSTLSYIMHARMAANNYIVPAGVNQLWRELPVRWVFNLPGKDTQQVNVLKRCPDTKAMTQPSVHAVPPIANRYMVTLHSKQCDRYANIQLLAQGDISHDGTQDVLIDVYQWGGAKPSYHGQQVLVLSRLRSQSPVKVITWRASFMARSTA